MTRAFTMIVEQDTDGNYVATVPELPGCHTQAKSLDALMDRTREAIALCLEAQKDSASGNEFVGVYRVTVGA